MWHAILWFAGVTGLSAQAPVDWEEAWRKLETLAGLENGDVQTEQLESELRLFLKEQQGTLDGEPVLLARVRVLETALTRRAGVDVDTRELETLGLSGLTPLDAWSLARQLPAGPAKVRAVLSALERTDVPSNSELLLAWNTGVGEARALRLEDGALPLQRILHERYVASWSAIDLALTLSRLGDVAGVDAVLSDSIEREQVAGRPTADLWSRWGIASLGFGDEKAARGYLGHALARGSKDAGLVLGRMALRSGHLKAARNGLRPSILSDPPASWALRGWGLTLLPPAHTEPRTGFRSR